MGRQRENRRWEKQKHPHKKKNRFKYGFYRYDSTIAIPDGANYRAYDVEIVIRNDANGKHYLYDVVGIREDAGLSNALSNEIHRRQGKKDLHLCKSISQSAEGTHPRLSLVSTAEDAAYMDAVKRGDMETAQKMVREAAAKAMPNNFFANGNDIATFFHQTQSDKDFYVFDDNMFNGGVFGRGFYFGYGDESDFGLGRSIGDVALFAKNPFQFNPFNKRQAKKILNEMIRRGADIDVDYVMNEIDIAKEDNNFHNAGMSIVYSFGTHQGKEGPTMFRDILKRWGYDAIWQEGTEEVVVFDSNQIKLIEPVTYDDAGNVIPLSQRFNPQNDDIRYSFADDAKELILKKRPDL